MQPEILDALYRLIGEYGWNWGMARNLINRQFGTNYTIKELQRFYLRRPTGAAALAYFQHCICLSIS